MATANNHIEGAISEEMEVVLPSEGEGEGEGEGLGEGDGASLLQPQAA